MSGLDARDEAYYEELQERWPAERASRKRKRHYQRKRDRRVVVRGELQEQPDVARMSKALLTAQRELADLQAEADARAGRGQETTDERV